MDAIFAALQALERGAEPRPAPPPLQPAKPSPLRPAAATPPEPPPLVQPHRAARPAAGLLQGLFEDGNSLLRAVIAAEVLQPPLAMREPAWTQQPNEPSI